MTRKIILCADLLGDSMSSIYRERRPYTDRGGSPDALSARPRRRRMNSSVGQCSGMFPGPTRCFSRGTPCQPGDGKDVPADAFRDAECQASEPRSAPIGYEPRTGTVAAIRRQNSGAGTEVHRASGDVARGGLAITDDGVAAGQCRLLLTAQPWRVLRMGVRRCP